uniref:Uncharacterized protein n=1 Tax=Timema poppense TaxID=170557 RepID=A0A7R9CJH6_TIMPO|nr:unnamed protein product [Timema poppensis]
MTGKSGELGLLCPGADGTLLSSSPGVNPAMIDLTALAGLQVLLGRHQVLQRRRRRGGRGEARARRDAHPRGTGRGPPPPSPPHAPHSLPRLPWLRSEHHSAAPHRHVALLNDVTETTAFYNRSILRGTAPHSELEEVNPLPPKLRHEE